MKNSDDLFTLIHSMSRGEKRHFRLYVKKYEKASHYLRLFNAIEQEKEYDEARIREKFDGRLGATREYLYTLILYGMRDYDDESTPELQILGLRQDITTLMNRRLYHQAEKRVEKAKKLCYHHELFDELLTIIIQEAYLPWVDRAMLFGEWKQLLAMIRSAHISGKCWKG